MDAAPGERPLFHEFDAGLAGSGDSEQTPSVALPHIAVACTRRRVSMGTTGEGVAEKKVWGE